MNFFINPYLTLIICVTIFRELRVKNNTEKIASKRGSFPIFVIIKNHLSTTKRRVVCEASGTDRAIKYNTLVV